jgi:hypothetical protein
MSKLMLSDQSKNYCKYEEKKEFFIHQGRFFGTNKKASFGTLELIKHKMPVQFNWTLTRALWQKWE